MWKSLKPYRTKFSWRLIFAKVQFCNLRVELFHFLGISFCDLIICCVSWKQNFVILVVENKGKPKLNRAYCCCRYFLIKAHQKCFSTFFLDKLFLAFYLFTPAKIYWRDFQQLLLAVERWNRVAKKLRNFQASVILREIHWNWSSKLVQQFGK